MRQVCSLSVCRRHPVADSERAPLKLYVIAGEPSGDLLAGRLMASLKGMADRPVLFEGVGGETMEREGLKSLFPMRELSVMGVAEILPKAFHLIRRMRQTAKDIRRINPDILVTVDAPAFCFGVIKRLSGFPVRKVHYVAPTVWAWRPKRAEKFARVFDHLMTLLPFEPPYFEKVGLKTTFVGHSVIEAGVENADGPAFRGRHGIAPDAPLLCVLPGSRMGEITRHLGPFREAGRRLHQEHPALSIVVPTVPAIADFVRSETRSWTLPVIVVENEAERFAAMAASNVALAASGTVALELAIARTPSVIAYRVHPLTHRIVKRLIRVQYANLVNLLLNKGVIPEFLQERCRATLLVEAVNTLLLNERERSAQNAAYGQAIGMLSAGERTPSENAAACVLRLIPDEPPNKRAL